MSGKASRRRKKRDVTLALIPSAIGDASARIELGLRLRTEANLTGRCACGATMQVAEIEEGILYAQMAHEDDCPAIDPELERAAERGEVADPGGDLLKSLRGRADS